MFALRDNDDEALVVTYNGLTMNDLSNPRDHIRLDRVLTETRVRAVTDERQVGDGAEMFDARKIVRILTIPAVMTAPDLASLSDKMRLIARTFDPALVSRNNPDVHGFLPLDGSLPTNDTATYPTGLIPTRLYARAQQPIQPNVIPVDGYAAAFMLTLVCRDPRGYLQAESTQALTTSTTVLNPKADYPSWPVLTITATGAVNTDLLINRTDDDIAGLRLSLDLQSGDVVVVDMERHTIHKNGVSTPELYTAGGWFDLDPGNNPITVNTVTNMTLALSWRPAFCL